MIKEVKINKIKQILDIISAQEYIENIQRNRSSFLFRGMPNADYRLATSLTRNCKEKQKVIEKSILRNFVKYAAIENPQIFDSIWIQLSIGQHHGLPTRLLDWTYSPLIGLHFATAGENFDDMIKHDCVLWKIDIIEMNNLLPKEYKRLLSEENAYLFTIDMLSSIVKKLDKYDDDMKGNSMVLLEPPSIDQRIINQYSYFSIVPNGIDDIECFLDKNTNNTVKYIISKNIRWEIRDMLDNMNINERILFPGLDGISSWLKRHYYVK